MAKTIFMTVLCFYQLLLCYLCLKFPNKVAQAIILIIPIVMCVIGAMAK